MGVPGVFHMTLRQGARPEPPVWGGRAAIGKQDRVPGPAPFAPLGGSVAQRRGRGLGFQGWKALESHFSSAGQGLSLLLSPPCFLLWPSPSRGFCVSVPIFACLALHHSVSFCFLFLVSLCLIYLIHPLSSLSSSLHVSFCIRLSFALTLHLSLLCKALFLSRFCLPSSPSPSAFTVSPLPCHPAQVSGGNRPGGGECHSGVGPGEGRAGQWTRGYCTCPGKSPQSPSPIRATG